MRYRIQVSTEKQLDEALSLGECEYVYAPVRLLSEETRDKDRVIAVPSVFVCEPLRQFREMGFTKALAHTIGHISVIRGAVMSIYGGLRLNITNSAALERYKELGLSDSVVSIELSLRRIKALKSSIPTGAVVYGKLPVMLLRRFPQTDGLIDRKNKFFPLIKGEGEAELLNPDTLILSDKISDFSDLDFAVLLLSPGESPREILDMYLSKAGIKTGKGFTRGLY